MEGNQKHTISTESDFSPNHLTLNTEAGKQYFIQQYIKPGVITGGANLKQVDLETGKKRLLSINLHKLESVVSRVLVWIKSKLAIL